MVRRLLTPSKASSFFLFGARGTGKSTLLRQDFFSAEESTRIDLLLPSEFDRLVRKPESLLDQIRGLPPSIKWVILDEVQKIPQLLDLVHYAIEEYRIKFALSGSSARKLKRGGANLLAGRAFVYNLFPLTAVELGNLFDIASILNFGSLPKILELESEQDRVEYLTSYAHTYIREEIVNEQIIRSLPPFRKFLEVAAQMNGTQINYSAIARDVGVDDKTVKNYYSILEDTLIGFFIEPYHASIRKAQSLAPRFYFFDTGVKRAIEGTLSSRIVPQTYAWGKAFEHLVIAECVRLNSYKRLDYRFYFLRTHNNAEIDLIIQRPGKTTILIEIKSTAEVDPIEVRKLEALAKDMPNSETVVLSLDPHRKKIGNTLCVPWLEGLHEVGLV